VDTGRRSVESYGVKTPTSVIRAALFALLLFVSGCARTDELPTGPTATDVPDSTARSGAPDSQLAAAAVRYGGATPTRTEIRQFLPEGEPRSGFTGGCDRVSFHRTDTVRCGVAAGGRGVGSNPCFPRPGRAVVVCAARPWREAAPDTPWKEYDPAGVEIQLDGPLPEGLTLTPRPGQVQTTRLPDWLELANGSRCTALHGGTRTGAALNGVVSPVLYECDDGLRVAGEPDRAGSVWYVDLASEARPPAWIPATALLRVPVVIAWY
jgi:hypothetical protein